MAELESVMEEKLIAQLTTGISQWTYRKDLKTEDDLWNNLRAKLNANNIAVLEGKEITDKEMEQIKEFIKNIGTSTYKAALWLSGEHGIAQIPLVREDASLGQVQLLAVNNREIAGGHSSYEVINQYQSNKKDSSDRNRRFDVTLLINGLPMIHIELKNRQHPIMDAFRQIQKYVDEGKFRDLFGLVQMFVVSNGVDTSYIAPNSPFPMNSEFLIRWVDKNNKPVDDYLEFAKSALNIPAAHYMVGKYSLLDNSNKRLILLRPYQIHAIEAVKEATRQKRSGYVWHTTGSGKTITSFNVTNNLLDILGIDKTIFLIDRKDLDEQTSKNFLSYAKNADIQIDQTEYTDDLEKKLLNSDRQAIITTIQKFQRILGKFSEPYKKSRLEKLEKNRTILKSQLETAKGEDAKKIEEEINKIELRIANEKKSLEKLKFDRGREDNEKDKRISKELYNKMLKLKSKNLAFVVDECHRCVSPESKRYIESFFDNPQHHTLWYGFTGTPIFDENSRSAKGDLARTTLQEYDYRATAENFKNGKDGALHKYTIKDALHDHSVLGFKIDYRGERRDKLIEIAEQLNNIDMEQLNNMSDIELESFVIPEFEKQTKTSFYDNEKHREEVINYIINKCSRRFRLSNDPGQAYEAILTVPSIAIAQKYYEEIKKFIADGKVEESIRRQLADFPKIAITYSVGENEEGALANHHKMEDALKDYNAMFNTDWKLDQISSYNSDLNDRLARKTDFYKNRKEQLDLVIVVDRLLTGFDAPCLAIVFLDRPPLSAMNMIQTFSRTNRIYDKSKQWGEIVTMQTPALYEKAVNEALDLYSNGGSNEVCAPTYKQTKSYMSKAAKAIKDLISKLPDGNINIKAPTAELKKFAKLFQNFDSKLDQIRIYDEWQEEDQLKVLLFSYQEIENLVGKYQNVIEELKRRKDSGGNGGEGGEGGTEEPDPLILDIEYELESVKLETIDYNYIVMLIQSHIPEEDNPVQTQIFAIRDDLIDEYIGVMGKKNIKLANVIKQVWSDISKDPSQYRGKFANNLIRDRIDSIIDEKLGEFASEMCINLEDLKFKARTWQEGNKLVLEGNYNKYVENGGELSKLKYNKCIKETAETLIKEEIAPLLHK